MTHSAIQEQLDGKAVDWRVCVPSLRRNPEQAVHVAPDDFLKDDR
jgi:hypothetical protein